MGRNGAAEEFVLDLAGPEPEPEAEAPVARTPRAARRGAGLRHPAVLWVVLAVLLAVSGVIVAPPAPGPAWGVGPAWVNAPVPRWTTDLGIPAASVSMVSLESDHLLVGGADRLDAYDNTDGALSWSVADVTGCQPADGGAVCLSGSGAQARVVIVDASGSVRELPYPRAVAAMLEGGNLAVLTAYPAGDHELTVLNGLDPDAVRWSTIIEAQPDLYGDGPPGVWAQDGLVLSSVGGLYRADTGERIPGDWSWPWLSDRPLVAWGVDDAQLIRPGGSDVVDLPGLGRPALIDDGAQPSVTIVESTDGTTANALTSDGEALWSSGSGSPLVRLGDVILMTDVSSEARDVRTGDVRWTLPGLALCPCRGAAPGLLLSVLTFGPDYGVAGNRLIGLRMADGAILWEITIADDALVVDTDDAFAVLAGGHVTLYTRT